MGIADMRLDQREISLQPAFLHIGPPVEHLNRFALGKVGAIAGGRVKRGDARAPCPDTLGQGALGDQFQLDLSGQIGLGKDHGIGRAGEGADQLFDHPRLDQGRKPDMAVPGVVVDNCQLARVAGGDEAVDQRVDQFDRRARAAKAADHHRHAV